jgi:hypothetical protein
MSILDVSKSTEIAQRINSKATDCFDNAYKAALLTEAMYVQGFLVCMGEPCIPIEYAWIELEQRIVDPTLPHLNRNAEELYYFAAQRLSVQQLKAVVEEDLEDYPEDNPLPVYGASPYEYYGALMLGGADYSTAHREAIAKCQELNSK